MTRNLPQINVRHQTTDPGSSRTTKYNKCQIRNKPSTCWHIIFKQQKIKNKGKKKKKPTDVENGLVDTTEEGEGGTNWESSTDPVLNHLEKRRPVGLLRDPGREQHWLYTLPSGEEAANGAAGRPRARAALTLYSTIWRRGGQWGCCATQGAQPSALKDGEGWDWAVGGRREVQEGGDICLLLANSHMLLYGRN